MNCVRLGSRFVSLGALALLGCSANLREEARPVKSQLLTRAQGGRVEVSSTESSTLAGTSLTVPANALSADTTITIASAGVRPAGGGLEGAGPGIAFGPVGLAFLVPATITLPYDSTGRPDDLLVLVEDQSGDVRHITHADLVIDRAAHTVTFQIDRLGRYAAALAQGASSGCDSRDAGPAAVDGGTEPSDRASWTIVPSGTLIDLHGVSGASSNDLVIVGGTPGDTSGHSGVLLTWNGNSWSLAPTYMNLLANSVGASSAIAVGEYGRGYACNQTRRGTGAWAGDIDTIWGGALRGVWLGPSGTFIVGTNGLLQYLSAAGTPSGWQQVPTGLTSTINAVWGSSSSEVYAVGLGVVLHTTNASATSGGTWSSDTPSYSDLRAVWGSSAADVYVAGGDSLGVLGEVRHSRDHGATWPAMTGPAFSYPLNAVGGTSSRDVYVVGNHGSIYHSTGDDHWIAETSPTTQDLLAVWGAPTGEVYAVGRAGTILKK